MQNIIFQAILLDKWSVTCMICTDRLIKQYMYQLTILHSVPFFPKMAAKMQMNALSTIFFVTFVW